VTSVKVVTGNSLPIYLAPL